ncbi:Tripartite tricarboxylate transporter TctA family protein [Thalassovita gelatinovora]|uniref:Tripartite tricarboxylate transporter TctA family protein n=1 Tax=Thalassovita gelatinovora TaxID=53501 RepID=A0A0P1FRQ6_THAGE|nr:tripartite tricarboxylate transporter permease [Thalassovita gelatinovora]QIZ79158.1 tripartite tricarboxylate transporter permease [Thalassovita gelatinovora]CUH63611.1 Tripartite tricarboxylate transporter TctA family protein [Thalassovita gelatinovora]SER00492.1 TctA family transporter [Thalassovita gelatinovora]
MELLEGIQTGLLTALSWHALLYCFIGVSVGTFVGVLPGIGALAAISLALPLTYYLDPTDALIMLAGIFYGAQYGGSTASILLNLPGTATAAITCLDGYPLAQQGKAPLAIFVTAINSFVGSSIAILLVMGFAPVIAEFALEFGAEDYFAVILLGLVAASTLTIGSPFKALSMVALGLLLGMVGTDVNTGQFRFTFGFFELADGFSIVAVAMGLFGVSEIIANIGQSQSVIQKVGHIRFRDMLPTRAEWRQIIWPTLRGSGIGSFVGALPGTGPGIASLMAYATELRLSKTPERFGNGALEGISAPEAANNASVQSAFIPMLSLGIPGDAIVAVLMGAMILHGITPGPNLINQEPQMFWGLIMSFWVGNLMLLILNIPLIGMWVKLLSIPYHLLYPGILVFICIGVYSADNNVFDIFVVLGFGVLGYIMRRTGFPATPVLLGFILGPLLEENFRRAMLLSKGDATVFFTSPISAVFMVLSLIFISSVFVPGLRDRLARKRPEVVEDPE